MIASLNNLNSSDNYEMKNLMYQVIVDAKIDRIY